MNAWDKRCRIQWLEAERAMWVSRMELAQVTVAHLDRQIAAETAKCSHRTDTGAPAYGHESSFGSACFLCGQEMA